MAKDKKGRRRDGVQDNLTLPRSFQSKITKRTKELASFFCEAQGLCFPHLLRDPGLSLTASIRAVSKRLAIAEWCLENSKDVLHYRKLAVKMSVMLSSEAEVSHDREH